MGTANKRAADCDAKVGGKGVIAGTSLDMLSSRKWPGSMDKHTKSAEDP